jgi:hypothetical protein
VRPWAVVALACALAAAGFAVSAALAQPFRATITTGCTVIQECPPPTTTQQSFQPGPDTTPPQLYGNLPNLRVEATGPTGAVVTFQTPSAFDPQAGPETATCTPASGTTFPLGSTLVTCSATDPAGNVGSRSFTVTVVDTTPPKLTIPTALRLRSWYRQGRRISYTASAEDLVDGPVPIRCSPPPRSVIPTGVTILVICTAVDSNGNRATASFPVFVTFARL